jgi:hypothetical protein
MNGNNDATLIQARIGVSTGHLVIAFVLAFTANAPSALLIFLLVFGRQTADQRLNIALFLAGAPVVAALIGMMIGGFFSRPFRSCVAAGAWCAAIGGLAAAGYGVSFVAAHQLLHFVD